MNLTSQSYAPAFFENYYTEGRHNLYKMLSTVLIALTVISCVTINIYFPAAAAEKVAEQIVNDVLHSGENSSGKDGTEQNNSPKTDNNQSLNEKSNEPLVNYSQRALLAVVNFLIPAAEAGQADLSINSPKIKSIRRNMEKRQSKLRSYYNSGAVGFTNNGLIANVSNAGLSVKQKSTAKKLVRAENKDRKALYSEIARANGHPEWEADIQKTFSKTWIKNIKSGWMYQNKSGKWNKK